MRVLRVRFTVRRMMVVVAAIALLCWLADLADFEARRDEMFGGVWVVARGPRVAFYSNGTGGTTVLQSLPPRWGHDEYWVGHRPDKGFGFGRKPRAMIRD